MAVTNSMRLREAFRIQKGLHQPQTMKDGPFRAAVPITCGYLIDPVTNTAHHDFRAHAQTGDEGYACTIHFKDTLKLDDKAKKVLEWVSDAESTKYDDHEWFITPVFETSDPHAKWLEEFLLIG
ncbi:hypothetical protein ASPWEDRAFT_31067 [Aspergillus wentii DTO 134E9]|uniref:Uncharacterized protein n=1 Tax=Aspergillus wentii DTO 134E9 TaxID=1073089 RepID=A0A1L9RB49_ASPWE|nr:uncharacterized protein ASPWEDRAFT_31067 [Aspergillus wentii DTO 134E9]OJJ32130.1 hypothetical protein ASPWEDRAFT_31067 [Aspergillus wentii DTO 134E9]